MRVAHVITRLILGGAQENTLYNCEDLVRRHGDDVLLITGPAEGPEGDLFERAERTLPIRIVPELRRAIAPWDDWRAYRSIKKILAQWKPDVVHTHSSKAGILGRRAAWALRVPAVVHTIHGLPFHRSETWLRNTLYIRLEKAAARWCHHIIAVADAMVRQAVDAKVAPREKFSVIPSGMEVETFLSPPEPPEVVRERWGIPLDALVIGKIARLFELKGHDDILEIAPALFADHPQARLLFVGGGPWHNRLAALAKSKGVAHRVHFTGLVPSHAIPSLLHAMDLVVHASYREGLARVLPQALLSAKPCVSYDIDGVREVVRPGETGFLAPPGDLGSLREGLDKLLRSTKLRDKLGHQGRALCENRFRHETMTENIRKVYERILRGR